MLVQEESNRVRRFVKGLRPELKKALIGLAPSTYNGVVEIASRLEEKNWSRLDRGTKEDLGHQHLRGKGKPSGSTRISTLDKETPPLLGNCQVFPLWQGRSQGRYMLPVPAIGI
jgi:hypothetical protein